MGELISDSLNRQIIARNNLLKLSRQYEAEEIHGLRSKGHGNWLEFLQQKARDGDEAALAVLRSRKEEMKPEIDEQKIRRQTKYLVSRREILENQTLSQRAKTRLLGMALMEKVSAGAATKISKHGAVIYTLSNGGKICDTGKAISFSNDARDAALAYMSEKWGIRRRSFDSATGKSVFILLNGQKLVQEADKNVFIRPEMRIMGKERSHGMGR